MYFRYIPEEWRDADSLSDKAKREINNINIELVHRLKSTDTAFSLGVYIPQAKDSTKASNYIVLLY